VSLRLPRPSRWPVRWRLAAASAALTLAILLIFAAVIGHLATQRIRDDFNRELKGAVRTLAHEVRITDTATNSLIVRKPDLNSYVLPNDATARIFDANGIPLDANQGAIDLGPPEPGIHQMGSLRIATAVLRSPESGRIAGYVQYARSNEHVDSTIERLWLLIAAGVLGGTLLASFAGLAIADRAMRPIASLTQTAREIAATRDPSRHMPEPVADDEVGELAQTLEQMLRSLDSARAEREDAMQKQRDFVADASHELRTPLTSVLANLELLQSSLETSAAADASEESEMVGSALRSSRRMSRLVADLLLLARADAGRVSRHRPVDLAEIAGNAALEAVSVAGDRTFQVDNGKPVMVDGSADELHRMVLNLLENAARHTPEGTSVELHLKSDDERGDATLVVADDGPGIPPEARDVVFNRFVRGTGSADTMPGPGTGLGLAIVRAVARSHGGEVTVGESASGGALFRITLPLAKSEAEVTPSLRPL
jgi:two-component system, OmpR family, sensor kinase